MKPAIFFLVAVGFSFHCSKKSSDSPSESDVANTTVASPLKVSAALSPIIQAMGSEISKLSGTLGGETFVSGDCTDQAEAKGRTADGGSFVDSSNRLKATHPRYPLNDAYCKFQKDTKQPDSFIGVFNAIKMHLCVLDILIYDNTEREVAVTKDQFKACITHLSEADQSSLLSAWADGQTYKKKVTGYVPSSDRWEFGDKTGTWAGAVKFSLARPSGDPYTMNLLLRNDDDVVALAANFGGATRSGNPDGFIAIFNKAKKTAYFEHFSQRIRTANGGSLDGVNRHARFYVEGELENSTWKSLSKVEGLSSELSLNSGTSYGASSSSSLVSGTAWSFRNDATKGIKSKTYQLSCSGTCASANSKANWSETSGSNSCNGTTTTTSCASVTALELSSDANTQFFLEAQNSAYKKTEDWFKELKVFGWSAVKFELLQLE